MVGSAGQTLTLVGTGFRAGNTASLRCVDSAGAALAAPSAVAASPTCASAVCTETVTVNATNLPAGSICIALLQNGDGSLFDYSAVGITNSSFNRSAPHAGPDMNVGRRGLSAAAVSVTQASR